MLIILNLKDGKAFIDSCVPMFHTREFDQLFRKYDTFIDRLNVSCTSLYTAHFFANIAEIIAPCERRISVFLNPPYIFRRSSYIFYETWKLERILKKIFVVLMAAAKLAGFRDDITCGCGRSGNIRKLPCIENVKK